MQDKIAMAKPSAALAGRAIGAMFFAIFGAINKSADAAQADSPQEKKSSRIFKIVDIMGASVRHADRRTPFFPLAKAFGNAQSNYPAGRGCCSRSDIRSLRRVERRTRWDV